MIRVSSRLLFRSVRSNWSESRMSKQRSTTIDCRFDENTTNGHLSTDRCRFHWSSNKVSFRRRATNQRTSLIKDALVQLYRFRSTELCRQIVSMFRSLLRNAVSVSRRFVVRRQVSTSRFFSSQGEGEEKTTIGRIDLSDKSTRMGIRFRCGVCRHSLSKTFNRQSYEQGLVIIRCDSCENLHLIADNIGWFKDLTNDGKTRFDEPPNNFSSFSFVFFGVE